MPCRFKIALLLAAQITTVLTAAPAHAQQQLGPDPGKADSVKQGVYIRDSAIAGDKLALAQRMERLKEWDKSADVYQEIVEKYADRVVPVDGSDFRFASVTLEVQKRLGKWPDDGLNAYRARYESAAAALLESGLESAVESGGADDAAALNRIIQLYFPTDAAKTAGFRLIELYIENGEFAAAAWLGERLLENHPGIVADRPKLLFRTALAEHLGGEDAAAKIKLDELKSKHTNATGIFRGQDVKLADELEKLLASPAAVAHGSSPDSWPIFAGDVSRSRVPDAAGRPGAKLVDIPLIRPKKRPITNPEIRGRIDVIERRGRDAGLSLGIMPVVDRGELFYQDNSRIYAKGLESGLTLPGWQATYGDDAKPRYAPGNAIAPFNTQLTVTVTDNSILAVIGQADRMTLINEIGVYMPTDRTTQLVCLDRATGAKKWSATPRQFPENLANLRTLNVAGSPLVIGDNVYVSARGGKPMQFEDAYVLCFALADGKFRWACYIASGNAQGNQFNGNPVTGGSTAHLAYAGGRIYAVTNLGAVAAIDAYAGTIAWLGLYPRPIQNMNGFAMPAQDGLAGSRKPWAQNPAIVKDGKVFCLPTDAQHILIYDAGTGDEIKRISIAEFENADALLGVIDDKLIVSGKNKVFCIKWPTYDPGKREDNLLWQGRASVTGAVDKQSEDTVRGRGFVTRDSVFIPTTVALRRFSMKSGRMEQSYPPTGTWAAGEGPGNVLVTSDQVIIAGSDSINVYSDLALARGKLDRAVEATPNDPLPRLRYAETLFAAGQLEPAVEKLDQAIQLLGGRAAMRPGPERDRVFARSLAFAERYADPRIGASDPAQANALYDRAGSAAVSPPQQVSYRISRSRFARAQHDFVTEVRLLQEILSDSQYRVISVPQEDGSGTISAGALAEANIGDRIRNSPQTYKSFEIAAADALAIAKQAKDPVRMLAVAQMYPNAKVAPEAMIAAADAYEAVGKFRPATQVLNQAYRKYRDSADKALIIEAQARNYLQLPNGVGIAIGRLNEGAKLTGGPSLKRALKLPDGDTIEGVTFAAASELLQKYSARLAAASLPEFNIPAGQSNKKGKPFLPETAASILSDVDQLVLPPREMRASARYDRVVTWSGISGLSVYAVGNNTPLGTNASIKQPPRGAFWIDDDLLIWTTDRLLLLKGDALAAGSDVSLKSLPPVDVIDTKSNDALAQGNAGGGQGEIVVADNGVVIVDNQIINLGGNFRGGRVVLRGGQVAGVPRVPRPDGAEQIEHVRSVGDRAVIATSAGRIAAIDLSNGQPVWQTRVGETPFDQLVANDDFVAVRFTDNLGGQIAAIETFGGQVIFRKSFGPESMPGVQNMALSPDGTLVYTLPDRICGKDLYEPGKAHRFGETATTDGNRLFDGAIGPDQLLVADGRILALIDQGQFVRVLSLEKGQEVNKPLETGLTGQANWNVWMRVVGPRLYIFNPRTVKSFNFDRLEKSWTGGIDQVPNVRDAFIGRRHVVLLDQPGAAENEGGAAARNLLNEPVVAPARCRLIGYGRYPSNSSDESGKLDLSEAITNNVGIDQWQPVDGGFYFHSVDRKAHFLQGSAKPEKN